MYTFKVVKVPRIVAARQHPGPDHDMPTYLKGPRAGERRNCCLSSRIGAWQKVPTVYCSEKDGAIGQGRRAGYTSPARPSPAARRMPV